MSAERAGLSGKLVEGIPLSDQGEPGLDITPREATVILLSFDLAIRRYERNRQQPVKAVDRRSLEIILRRVITRECSSE